MAQAKENNVKKWHNLSIFIVSILLSGANLFSICSRTGTTVNQKEILDVQNRCARSIVRSLRQLWFMSIPHQLRVSTDRAVVRAALASHQCCPGSNSGISAISGFSLLLVLSFLREVFLRVLTPVFPSPQKPPFPNSNSTRNQVDEEPLFGRTTSKSSSSSSLLLLLLLLVITWSCNQEFYISRCVFL